MHGLADNPLVSAAATVRRFAALPKAAASPAATSEIPEEIRQQLGDWADARAGISVPFPPGRLPDDTALAMRVRAASNCEQVIRDLVNRHMHVAGHAVAEFTSLRQRTNDSRAQRTAVRRAGVFQLSNSSIAQDSAPLMGRSSRGPEVCPSSYSAGKWLPWSIPELSRGS